MTVRVTCQLTGVDGKTCLDGKESNTESLTGTIKVRLTKVTTSKVSILPHISVPFSSELTKGWLWQEWSPDNLLLQNCECWREQNNVEVVCDMKNPVEHLSNKCWTLFPFKFWDVNVVSHSHVFQRILLYALIRDFCCCLESFTRVTTRFIFPTSVLTTCHSHIFQGAVAIFASGCWNTVSDVFIEYEVALSIGQKATLVLRLNFHNRSFEVLFGNIRIYQTIVSNCLL